jgi:predicted nucleic acid-binding protein
MRHLCDTNVWLALALSGHSHQLAAHTQPAPKRWMDAYLAAFAIAAGQRLVTFDQGFRSYAGLDVLMLI